MVSIGGRSNDVLGGGLFGSMSDEQWNQYLANSTKNDARMRQLDNLSGSKPGSTNSWLSGGGNGTSSTSNNNLLGGLGDLTKSDFYKSMTDQAKDLARFRLGLDKDQASFSYGLRDKEAEGNFGRQYKLDTQQRQFDRDINTDTQSALTQRLEKELTNRLEQQEKGINQENFATNRAIRLASRRLGG